MDITEIKKIITQKVVGKVVARHDEFGHHYQIGKGKTVIVVDSVTTKLIMDKPHLVNWAVKIGFEWMETRWATMTATNRDSYLQGAILAHTEVRDFAGDVGSQAHNILENWANDWIATGSRRPIQDFIPADANYRSIAGARSGEAVFLKSGCIPIACELLVGSRKYKSAGTLDMLVWNRRSRFHIPDQLVAFHGNLELKLAESSIFRKETNLIQAFAG